MYLLHTIKIIKVSFHRDSIHGRDEITELNFDGGDQSRQMNIAAAKSVDCGDLLDLVRWLVGCLKDGVVVASRE